jgi:hypothetical protein
MAYLTYGVCLDMYNTATDGSLDMALGRQISLLISLGRYGALDLYTRIPAMINYMLPSSSRCLTRDSLGRGAASAQTR